MQYLTIGIPAFVAGFLTCLVTLHVMFRERKPKASTSWRQVAEKGGTK